MTSWKLIESLQEIELLSMNLLKICPWAHYKMESIDLIEICIIVVIMGSE